MNSININDQLTTISVKTNFFLFKQWDRQGLPVNFISDLILVWINFEVNERGLFQTLGKKSLHERKSLKTGISRLASILKTKSALFWTMQVIFNDDRIGVEKRKRSWQVQWPRKKLIHQTSDDTRAAERIFDGQMDAA